MGFYDSWVLPRLLNQMMDTEALAAERQRCLAGVSGTVLEVGFGSGHNLPWYPEGVRRLVAVDPSRESAKLARKRIAEARFPVEYLPIGGEEIAAADHSFDSVVSTFTLCTVPDPIATLEQLRRVLKPDGRLFLIEHGLSKDPNVQKWQRRLNAFPNALCGGCNMNRDIRHLVAEGGFEFDQVEQFEMAEAPSVFAFTTRGVASPRRYPDEAARMEARTA